MKQLEKELNTEIGRLILSFVNGFGLFIKCIYYGIRNLKNRPVLIGLGVVVLMTTVLYFVRGILGALPVSSWITAVFRIVVLFFPLIYLACAGIRRMQEEEQVKRAFREIAFCGKDKRYPRLMFREREDNGREVFGFVSGIPLKQWEKNWNLLETAFDQEILLIEPMKSKRQVKMTTIGSYQMPDMLKWHPSYLSEEHNVIVIGENAYGFAQIKLSTYPHALIAGLTGSGKSSLMHCILTQTIQKGLIPFMFDFKRGVEFNRKYEEFGEVVIERKTGAEVLEMIVKETEKRLDLFRIKDVKKIEEYNTLGEKHLNDLVVYVDELAEMTLKAGLSKTEKEYTEEIERHLSSIARLGRAAGVHLVLATQRPDADVVPGQIKNNIPIRLCGHFQDVVASQIVLNSSAATTLDGTPGRMILSTGDHEAVFQSFWFNDDLLEDVPPLKTIGVLLPEMEKRIRSHIAGHRQPPPEFEIIEKKQPPKFEVISGKVQLKKELPEEEKQEEIESALSKKQLKNEEEIQFNF